jgi:cell division protein FtsL
MVLIAGLVMLVFAIAVQVQNGASSEELLFTFLMIALVTGIVHSGVSRVHTRDVRRDSERLAEEYKLKRQRIAEEYKLKRLEMKRSKLYDRS